MNVLVNGQLKDRRQSVISAFDHGFLYGIGLFETFRTYGGKPWLLERHAARLAEGCRTLGIRCRPDPGRIRQGITRLLEAEGLADAYIRWSVSAGEGEIGLPSGPYEAPVEIVYAKPLPEPPADKTVRLLKLRRTRPEGALRLKSFHYMNNVLAKRELLDGGAGPGTEGLFLNEEGDVCEGIVSNVFWVSGGVLFTPALETGPLPGITREFVLGLAKRSGVEVREGRFGWHELADAQEVFLTNSIQEIVRVSVLEDEEGRAIRRFDDAGGRSLTRDLKQRYRECAEGSIRDEPDILP